MSATDCSQSLGGVQQAHPSELRQPTEANYPLVKFAFAYNTPREHKWRRQINDKVFV